jgi:uncharacterized protein
VIDWSTSAMQLGLDCFRREQFFEAHEHWESVWLQSEEPEKTFIQALIQVAGSFFHFRRNNLGGARSMARKALDRLEKYPELYGGVRVEALRANLRAYLITLDTEFHEIHALPPIETVTE